MSDIDEIKQRLDVAEFIGKRVTLKKAGRNFKGICPFHSERTPSFMVSTDRQAWHCFGCGKGGSLFDFVMEYEHVDFREALEELADQAGVTLSRQVAATPQDFLKEKILEIHHLASEYYQYLFTSHAVGEKAREYLKDRGVSEKTMKTFGIGYSPNSWDNITKYLKKKGYDEKTLEDSGLLIPSSRGGYDRFRGRLMFPLRDHRGQTVGFSGRLLDPSIKEAKYINSPETVLYKKGNMVFALDVTKASIQKENTVVLMEGEFDVISSFQAGITNVVAIKGTALTEQQVYLLKRFAAKIIFALDSDLAGDHASRRGIEIAEKAGLEIHVASLPEGKDPDDVAKNEPGTLKKILKDAQSIYDYYFESVQKQVDMQSAYGKKHVSDELIPILNAIENPVVQAHYIKKLSVLLSVPEQAILDGMRKEKRKQSQPRAKNEAETPEKIIAKDEQDVYFLALLFQGKTPDLLKDIETKISIEAIDVSVRHIVQEMRKQFNESGVFVLDHFLSTIPQEWSYIVDQALLWDLAGIVESDDLLMKEWQFVITEMMKRYIKQQMHELLGQMKSEDTEEADGEISKKMSNLASQLRHLEKREKV